jgi:hypothetical protein
MAEPLNRLCCLFRLVNSDERQMNDVRRVGVCSVWARSPCDIDRLSTAGYPREAG